MQRNIRGVCAWRKDHVRIQEEGGHPQAKGRGLQRKPTLPQHFNTGLPVSRRVLFKPVVFVIAALANYVNHSVRNGF